MRVKPSGLAPLVAALGCIAAGLLAPAAGCNGTGTTPVCDFPDGANNPEAGCGVLIEASAEGAAADAGTGLADGSREGATPSPDATSSPTPDAATSSPDAADDASDDASDDAGEAGSVHVTDAALGD